MTEGPNSDGPDFLLSNRRIAYAFRASDDGVLEHLHFGGPIASVASLSALPRQVHRDMSPEFEGRRHRRLNDTSQEYPTFGVSDYRYPAFGGVTGQGHSVFAFAYQDHRLVDDKPGLDGLPGARGGDCQTLVVRLRDAVAQVECELFYTLYADHDVLARSARITNVGPDVLSIDTAFSSAIDLPAERYDILHLTGSWAREFQAERMPLSGGRFEIASARGASGSAHSPFLAVLERDATETSGRVCATALVYSGNFAISVETGEFGGVRMLAGVNPLNFGWRLEPGASFTTPEALHVFTQHGLEAMSHAWHDFIRDKISPPAFARAPRPTYLNTWEAAYFDVDEHKAAALADKARAVGLEMFVLDDGWFEGRVDDTTSLGDWVPDARRFPAGIAALGRTVRDKGLRFGLWVEPEMVSEASALFKAHPDWIVRVPDRAPSLGRQQLILDLSRREVVDHLYAVLDTILSTGVVDYIKWDMNRYMTEPGSAALPACRQREVAHRYMLGLYDLLDRLTGKHPDVLFETCAAGGGRFDLGMLRYMAQGWVSDMSDPIGRLQIVSGASYLFPPATMAAYIGPSPNHQTGRVTSLDTRFNAAFFCGARGLSLAQADIDADLDTLQDYARRFKASAHDVVNGRFHRLHRDGNETCWQLTAPDGATVYVGYFHLLAAPNAAFRRARLRGLDPADRYRLDGTDRVFDAAALMASGLDLPVSGATTRLPGIDYLPKGDFTSALLVLERV